MNIETGKLPHSIIGALVSWFLAGVSWAGTHIGLLAGAFAVLASLYSIRASRETIKLRRRQRIDLGDEP